MIKSYADAATRDFWEKRSTRRLPSGLRKLLRRKLIMLDSAKDLRDLLLPPGNRLHPLHGDRAGQHAIRINDQYRLCFTWNAGNALNVEITDYH